MGLFSSLKRYFGRKYVQNCENAAEPIQQTRKVLLVTENDRGYPVVTWNGNSVIIHSTVTGVNRLRAGLVSSQGITLPIGWQSVYVSNHSRIDNLFLLVNELTYTDYLRQSGNTLRSADGVNVL